MNKEINEVMGYILKQLANGVKRVDMEAEWEGGKLELTGYRMGDMFRIDIKPR